MNTTTTCVNEITLKLTGLGAVPSFKNKKMLTRNRRTGKPMLITDPKKKRWMEAAIRSIELQLRGLYPTAAGAMRGECPKPLPTASCLPLDDSLGYMIPGEQSVKLVPKGEEGCIITITKL